jgi:hypothetical protein
MRLPSILASTVFAATVLGSTAALAGPTVGGVALPDAFYFDTTTSYETLVTQQNTTLTGVFSVNDIRNQQTAAVSYTYGDNNVFLTGYFDGFHLASVNQGQFSTTLTFTGGQLYYYTNSSDVFTNSAGSPALDIAAMTTSGNLWLQVAPELLDANGTTLVITLNGFNPTTTSFTTSNAFAVGDVVGGAAMAALDTNFFSNLFLNQTPDIVFSDSATLSSTGACGTDFQVCGSNNMSAQIVPEPVTLSVFGAGLAGAVAMRRRKAKKA